MTAPLPSASDDWWADAAGWLAEHPGLGDEEAFELVCLLVAQVNGEAYDEVVRALTAMGADRGAETVTEVVELLRREPDDVDRLWSALEENSGMSRDDWLEEPAVAPETGQEPAVEPAALIRAEVARGASLMELLTTFSNRCGVTPAVVADWVRAAAPQPQTSVEDAYEAIRVAEERVWQEKIANAVDRMLADPREQEMAVLLGSSWRIPDRAQDNVQRHRLDAQVTKLANELGLPGTRLRQWDLMRPVFASRTGAIIHYHRSVHLGAPEPATAPPPAAEAHLARLLDYAHWRAVELTTAAVFDGPGSAVAGELSDVTQELETVVRRLSLRRNQAKTENVQLLAEAVMVNRFGLATEVHNRQTARFNAAINLAMRESPARVDHAVNLLRSGPDLAAIARHGAVAEADVVAWVNWFADLAAVRGSLGYRWLVLQHAIAGRS